MIKFAYTILYVEDVTRTIAFYEKAYGFKQSFITPDNSCGEVASGETKLSFASKDLAKSNLKDEFLESSLTQKPFGIEIGFTTEDVPKTIHQAVEAGALLIEEPKTKPWGQVVGYVRDFDGFLIEICTPVSL
jgi:lactoylglutathione lyase